MLTEAEVLKIYRRAWLGDSPKELAQKYNVSETTIFSIKHGRIWSAVTGHVKGTIPNFIVHRKPHRVISGKEKLIIRDYWTQEMLDDYAGILLLEDYYLKLLDYNEEDAYDFKRMFWQKRIDSGYRGKRFPKEEVIEFYEEFKNGCNKNDL